MPLTNSKTMNKFLYPDSVIKSYQNWHLLLRFEQSTLGSLILVCKQPYRAYSELPGDTLLEQHKIIRDVERILKEKLNYSKINYLMLMMVDPEVHFHIIPRFEQGCLFQGKNYPDPCWPGAPDLGKSIEITPQSKELLRSELARAFSEQTIEKPSQKKYGRLYTSGCFDIFHHGHLNIIQKSKSLCEHLIVGVSTDELILKEKGRLPIIPFEERISILQALKEVDEVIPQTDKNKQKVVSQYRIDAISVGSDWLGKYPEVTCAMEYFDYTPNVSSTLLKQKLNLSN